LFLHLSTVLLNARLQQEDLQFYFISLLSCDFSKSAFEIYCNFPLLYWLFKEKFDIFETVRISNAIFWGSTEKTKFFVWIPSFYFYSKRLWRYSALSPHCSFLAVKVFGVQAQLVSLITRSTSKLFISNFGISGLFYKFKRSTEFYCFIHRFH